MAEITEESAKVEGLISEIASASQEQSEGIAQINIGLERVDKVIQQSTSIAEETASSVVVLHGRMIELTEFSGISGSVGARKQTSGGKQNRAVGKRIIPSGKQINALRRVKDDELGGDMVKSDMRIKLDSSEFGKF